MCPRVSRSDISLVSLNAVFRETPKPGNWQNIWGFHSSQGLSVLHAVASHSFAKLSLTGCLEVPCAEAISCWTSVGGQQKWENSCFQALLETFPEGPGHEAELLFLSVSLDWAAGIDQQDLTSRTVLMF